MDERSRREIIMDEQNSWGVVTAERNTIAEKTNKSRLIENQIKQTPSSCDQTAVITQHLAENIGHQKFGIWFKSSTKFTLTNNYLNIAAANLFIAGWLEKHFQTEIKQAAKTVIAGEPKIVFTIDSALGSLQKKSQQPIEKHRPLNRNSNFNSKTILQSPKRKQLKLHLDTFIVGSGNQLAYNAAKVIIAEQKSPFNPLFFHGGYGVGKTHLMQGICNAVCQKRPQTKWMYMSAEDFANQFVLALKTRKLESFRNRIRQTDLLAIDDIHFLASKPSTQEEFLHTFNTIDLAGKQVILASDAHPKMIGQLSEKLVNRFVSGMVASIEAPDLATRQKICKQFAIHLKTHIPESVIHYAAENVRSNIRELQGAMLKLTAFASLQNQKISLFMAKEVLAEHLERCDPIVHISDIESEVAEFFQLTPADLHSPKKDKTVSLARHFAMYLTRKHTNMSSAEVGRFMGNKNHATVLMACKKIEGCIKRNTELTWKITAGNKISKARTILAKLEEYIAG